jgi:hypothetical protein
MGPRCLGCRKKLTLCECNERAMQPTRAKKGQVKNKVDTKGNEWCGKCSCRVNNGICSNVTCSSRK